MKITILNGTTKNPLQTIGERAGICWGGDITDKDKNIKRAIDCIKSGHCFDGNTSILTEKGFIKFSDYKGERVYQFDRDTSLKGLVTPEHIIRTDYSGTVYNYRSTLGTIVTDEHRMFGKLIDGIKDLKKNDYDIFLPNSKPKSSRSSYASNGERRFLVPSCSNNNICKDNNYFYGCLVGFWLGDGCIGQRAPLKFHLRKQRKIDYLKFLAEKNKLDFIKCASDKYNLYSKESKLGQLFDNQYVKNGAKYISGVEDVARLSFYYGVIDGLINSDGCIKSTGVAFYNKSNYLIEWLLNYGCLLGYNVKEICGNRNGTRCVWFRRCNKINVNDCRKKKDFVRIYKVIQKPMYCVSVPSGLIMVKGDNGQTFICGNCRPLEYVSVEFVVEDMSARAIRELYTHIAGGPTRLQASTRYVDYDNFSYYTPTGNEDLKKLYDEAMKSAAHYYKLLIEEGMKKEDAANLLPLGMMSKVVMKTNLRMIENLMNQRLCTRAYKEMRAFAILLSIQLSEIGDEWEQIVKNLFVPKCKKVGYCTEAKCCGLSEKKEIEWRK